MTEPTSRADSVEKVIPDVWTWSLHDNRIDFVSTSFAFTTGEGTILIDPLPLEPDVLANLGTVHAIVLTSGTHQRSSWRYRRELDAPVWIPALVETNEEEPDGRYSEGDDLPGRLKPVFTPGAGTTQHTLLLERDGGVAFTPDLFVIPPGGSLMLTPAQYVHDPEEQRRTAETLLDLDFRILCTGHGGAVTEDAKGAIRAALDQPQRS
jgi:glyoxylase-like metal-dependent hydrolase (beta-lactamase superfamily II)